MLEEMLESIKMRDENPKDVPPELPLRPTLKWRLPSSRSLLHKTCKFEGDAARSPSAKDPNQATEEERPGSRRLDEAIGVGDSLDKSSGVSPEEPEYHEEVIQKPVASQCSLAGAGDEISPDCNGCNGYADDKGTSQDHSDELSAAGLEDLEKLSAKMKAELEEKELKNLALSQQVQDYHEKWVKCEENLKNMEEIYQKQIDTLKMNIATVQTSIAANDAVWPPKTVESQTQTGHHTYETGHAKDVNDMHNVSYHSTKQFEQKKQTFEVDALAFTEGKSASAAQSIKDLRHLEARYAAWQKEYMAYLHDAKVALKKRNKRDGVKPRRRWWLTGCCGVKTLETV